MESSARALLCVKASLLVEVGRKSENEAVQEALSRINVETAIIGQTGSGLAIKLWPEVEARDLPAGASIPRSQRVFSEKQFQHFWTLLARP